MLSTLTINISRQGLHGITPQVQQAIASADVESGVCVIYIQHTSASLLIQENYDPSAQADLEAWLNRLVPEDDPLYTHTLEGADDMPAHIKSALTNVSLSIPIADGQLLLGTWQGIYLWEHRRGAQQRKVMVKVVAG